MSEQTKTVWILGAGFSRSLGAPLLNGILSKEALSRVRHTYGQTPNFKKNFEHAEGVIEMYELGCWGVDRIKDNKEWQWEHAEEFIEALDNLATLKHRRASLTELCARGTACKKFFSGSDYTPEAVKYCAVRLLAAECCEFLESADRTSERWLSYRVWASNLSENDTILTFNYDRTLNGIVKEAQLVPVDPARQTVPPGKRAMWIPSPAELKRWNDGVVALDAPGPALLKLHGSVDWILREGEIVAAERLGDRHVSATSARTAAIHYPEDYLAIASPGPTKTKMIASGGPLECLWEAAEKAIREANAIVFVGYRIPPTDASTRKWFIDNIRENNMLKKQGHELHIYSVLGEDIESADSRRLRALLQGVQRHVKVHRQPMRAEDFLALYRPDHLYEFQEH